MKYTYKDYKEKMDKIFELYPDKIAVTCMDSEKITKQIRFREVKSIIEELQKELINQKIEKRSKIAVILPQNGSAAVLTLAFAYLGYINVSIDISLPIEEQERLLDSTGVNVVFTTGLIYNELSQYNSSRCFFEVGTDVTYKKMKEVQKSSVKTPELTENLIAILFSSGTTGQMKGIEISYNSIIYAQECVVQYANLNNRNTFLNILPLNHIAGYTSLLFCFLTGVEMGFVSEVTAYSLSKALIMYNPTDFIMIPKVYGVIKDKIIDAISKKSILVRFYAKAAMKICGFVRRTTGVKLRILTKPIWKAALGKKMMLCGCGTAPCPEDLVQFYLDLGIDFINVYGATETGFPICAENCNAKYPIHGVGSIKQFPEIDILVVNPDENGVGEVRVKTPLIMLGYYNDSELSAAAFDENGYFKTGDCGYIDKANNLYITGRIKENIMLANGKKASPIDVDNYILKHCKNINVASCGVDCESGYDEIHLFLETANKTSEELEQAENIIKSIPKSIYKISQIHYIDRIPATSTGKIKRFELKQIAKRNSDLENDDTCMLKDVTREDDIIAVISRIAKKNFTDLDSELKNDIGMDSLELFELCVAIDEKYGVSIEEKMHDKITVLELIQLIESLKSTQNGTFVNVANHPIERKKSDYTYLRNFNRWSRMFWKFEVSGLENIKENERYIFCPNHESYFDGMWIVGSMEENRWPFICSMAAESLYQKKIFKKGLIAMGAIPVFRGGNTSTAMKRAYECISNEDYNLLIHPEGTRTRTGEFGEFKSGAARLAKDTGLKIMPICINGAYEVFPPNKKIPRFFDWKHMRKYKIQIQFGEPVETEVLSEEYITEEVRRQIVDMKQELKRKN